MYACQYCNMTLDDSEDSCWLCSTITDFSIVTDYFYIPIHEKSNFQTTIQFPDEISGCRSKQSEN